MGDPQKAGKTDIFKKIRDEADKRSGGNNDKNGGKKK